jgi:hypothetical protein
VNRIRREIADTTEDELKQIARRIEQIIERQNKFYFGKMADKIVGKRRTPSFVQEAGSQWKPLSQNTIARKLRESRPTSFYKETGELRSTLKGMNGQSLQRTYAPFGAGPPEVRVLIKKNQSFSDVTDRPTTDLRRFRSARLVIYPLGRQFEDENLSDPRTASSVFDGETVHKVNNPNGENLRPFRHAFFLWWINEHLPRRINEGLR